MANYYAIRTRATRPEMLREGLNDRERAAYERHVPWLQRQADAGVMVVVGRTRDADANGWALAVIKADTEDAARAIMNDDPFVTDGVVTAELFAFDLIMLKPENA